MGAAPTGAALVARRRHALDDGRLLAGLVHALTGVAGRGSRQAWAFVTEKPLGGRRSRLAHVRMLLAAPPAATLWRMGAADTPCSGQRGSHDQPHRHALGRARQLMSKVGARAYEEDRLDQLLRDLRHGHPPG